MDPDETNVIKKKVTSKDIEVWEVAALEKNLVVSSVSSGLFERIQEKRKIRHDGLIKKLKNGLNEINQKTEENVKLSSAEYKAHLKNFEEEMKKTLESIDNPEVTNLNSSNILDFQIKAAKHKNQQNILLDELYQDLNKFEDKRAMESEELLHEVCEEIRTVGYFLPYDLQNFIELETLKMNQLSLNNRRCYADLKLTLSLINENSFKSFVTKIYCIQEKWVKHKIQEAELNYKEEYKRHTIIPPFYKRLELKNFQLMLETSADNVYSICNIEEWKNNVLNVANNLENHGRDLVELYKKTLNAVYQNFDKEINIIVDEIKSFENPDIEDRIIKPLLFQALSDQTMEYENLEFFWQDKLSEASNILKDVTNFLQDIGVLWNNHAERLCESKKLILKALEKEEENSEPVFQDLEVKFNLALDVLRQEFNESKLDKAHEAVIAILNSIKEQYEAAYLNQVKTVEDFYVMMDLEVEILSAETKELIYITHSTENSKNTQPQCDPFSSLEGKFIYKEIQKCINQIRAIKSWKFGLWTALEIFSRKTKDYCAPQAEAWIQMKIENLAKKMSVRLELLEVRFGRVRVEFYEKRLKEIECHQEIYNSHKEGVKLALKKMKNNLEALTTEQVNELEELKNYFLPIEKSAKQENRPGIIKCSQIMIEKKQRELEDKLKFLFNMFKAEAEIEAWNIGEANINFMKAIKLFHEGGNYSVEEGKMFIAGLEIIDKEITTEIKNITRDATKDENDLIKKVSTAFAPTIQLLEGVFDETLFYHEIQERLREFKEKVESAIEALRSDFNLLQSQTDCLLKVVNQGKYLTEDEFYEFWTSLLNLLYKNISNLFYPMKPISCSGVPSEVILEGESTVMEEEEADNRFPCFGTNKFSAKATISHTPTFRSTEVTENFPCTNYKWELFKADDPPQNDGTFMANISNGLWSEFDFMQKAACLFYKKTQGRKIIRDDLLALNYDSFVSETLPKFQYYNFQCEQVWLQTIVDFLPVIGRIKTAANNFIQQQLDGYERNVITTLCKFENDFVSTLKFQTDRNSQIFESLDKKLLPLHGYPWNSKLLEDLQEEVVQKTSSLGIEWDNVLQKYINKLKCFRIFHVKERTDIQRIQSQGAKLRDKIFIDDLGNTILNSVIEYANRGGYYTTRSLEEQMVPADGAISEEYKLNIGSLADSVKGIHDYMETLENLIRIEQLGDTEESEDCVESNNSSGSITETNSFVNLCFQKLNILLPPLDSDVYVQNIMRRIEERFKKMNNYANSQTNVQEKELFKWLDIWKCNVKKIKKLYTVRYEEKPKVEEKPTQLGEVV